MHNKKMISAPEPVAAVRRSDRAVPTAQWVTTTGRDGRTRLSMRWTVPARIRSAGARHAA